MDPSLMGSSQPPFSTLQVLGAQHATLVPWKNFMYSAATDKRIGYNNHLPVCLLVSDSTAKRKRLRMELENVTAHEGTALLFNHQSDEGEQQNGTKFNLAHAYMKLLDQRPLLTKVVTSAVITSLSDLIAQAIERNEKIDVVRNFAMFLTGALLTAPIFHLAYDVFEHVIPATNAHNLVLQVLADALIAQPIWLILFFPFISIVEGERDKNALVRTLQVHLVPALKLTWLVFPAVQLANFSLVPKHLRVLVLNVCDVVYTAIISLLAHGNGPSHHTAHS